MMANNVVLLSQSINNWICKYRYASTIMLKTSNANNNYCRTFSD